MSDFITNAELRIEAERLCDENERLQDENARLRSCLSDDAENARQIIAENAKLRELLSDYSDCLDTALWLAADAGYPVMPARDKFLSLEKRKRELGIEMSQ